MTNNVFKLPIRADAAILKRFTAKGRAWDYEKHGLDGPDLQYIQHMAMGLLSAAQIDINWLFTFTTQILGNDAPIELLINRYCHDIHEYCQILAFISWEENMVKHKTI